MKTSTDFNTLLVIGNTNEILSFLNDNAKIQANIKTNEGLTRFYYFNSRLFFFRFENKQIADFGEYENKRLLLDLFNIQFGTIN